MTDKPEAASHGRQKVLYRTEQAAAYLGLKPATLAKFRDRKTGPPYYRMGSAILYEQSALDEYMARSLVEPGRPSAA